MRVSLNWVSEYIDLPTRDVEQLRRTLAMLGHEVDGVEIVEPGWSKVVIARVLTVEQHPNADKVRVCTVTTGGDPITVVCGAWNFEAGAIVAFANPGAVLPGDFEIGVRDIRGVESHGMICSEKELELGDDAEGILVLSDDSPVGEPLESILALPDVVFDLGITPNRPDAMSMVGIARDLGAWYRIPVTLPAPTPATEPGKPGISVTIEDPQGNPRFVARQVDGVEARPSPLWMRHRLSVAGIRPISNLVDVTNYVMLELGQPLHVFDADRIEGQHLTVRRAKEGETLVTLDGVERRLNPDDLVICDADGPTSLAGTMGGADSEVSDETRTALIEAASWDPPTIMYMSRRHGLRSEASARFERGVDPELPPLASARAAELILALAGGSLREGWVDQVARRIEPVTLELALREVARQLGDGFDRARVSDLLARLGFGVEGDDPLTVAVPSYRPDVTRPIDLVEEVARLADYDTFEGRLRLGTGGGLSEPDRLTRRLRSLLTGVGYSQAITIPFVMPSELDAFGPPAGHELTETVLVKNPLSDEEAVLRPSLLPGLLRVLRHNRNRGIADVSVFELGRVFHARPWDEDRRVPDQPTRLGIAAIGVVGPRRIDGEGLPADVHAITGLLRHVSGTLGLELRLEQDETPGFHPTRTAVVMCHGAPIGHAGELHPLTARAFDLDGRVAVAEVDLESLLSARREIEYRPVSPYPPADFDLSFEVHADVPSAELALAVESGGGDLVESVRIFDEFRGADLPEDHKALALRVRLRAPDRTLQADEISGIRAAMIETATGTGAKLRGSA